MSEKDGSPFQRVAIVGLGLMGGSLARALKARAPEIHIASSSLHPGDLRAGLEEGAVDVATENPAPLLEGRDLVVYATPLSATLELLEEHRPFLEPGTLLTDLVSLKNPILEKVESLGLGPRFVGSHPMVGGTETGFVHSNPELFSGGRVWVVPGTGVPPADVDRVRAFWRFVGAVPAESAALDHDDLMALVSHLPQLTSNALALVLKRAGLSRELLGSGGRDMIRLARSDRGMWEDLLEAAPKALPDNLRKLEAVLAQLRASLEAGRTNEIGDQMEETRRWLGDER